MIRMKRLMNDVSSNMSTAKLGKMANQTRTHSALKGTRRSIFPSVCMGCFVTVSRLRMFPRWMRWFHSGEIRHLLTRLSPSPVSKMYRTVRRIC